MPVSVGNSTVNTSISNSTITTNQTQSLAYKTSNRNSIRPSLLLDFARSKTVDPRITFTRASSATYATYFNNLGVLTTAANNVSRIDYNPATGACNGLLIEGAGTNWVRNNTMVGAVAAITINSQSITSLTNSSGVATATTSVAHGIVSGNIITVSGCTPTNFNGIYYVNSAPTSTTFTYIMVSDPGSNASIIGTYIAQTQGNLPTNYNLVITTNMLWQIVDINVVSGVKTLAVRYMGNSNVGAGTIGLYQEVVASTPASIGQGWTFSQYASLVNNSYSNIVTPRIRVTEFDSTQAQLVINANFSVNMPTSDPIFTQRSVVTATLTGATTVYVQPSMFYTCNGGQTDFTVRFAAPQLENSYYPSSPILTTGSVATRSEDRAFVNIQNLVNSTQGTIVMDFVDNYLTPTGTSWGLFTLQDSGGTNYFRARVRGGGVTQVTFDAQNAVVVDGGASTTNNWNVGGINKIGYSWSYISSSNYIFALNGITGSYVLSTTLPANTYQLNIGTWPNFGNYLNGRVLRIVYYPVALTATELKTLTTG